MIEVGRILSAVALYMRASLFECWRLETFTRPSLRAGHPLPQMGEGADVSA
jgi:hypothetical protein